MDGLSEEQKKLIADRDRYEARPDWQKVSILEMALRDVSGESLTSFYESIIAAMERFDGHRIKEGKY